MIEFTITTPDGEFSIIGVVPSAADFIADAIRAAVTDAGDSFGPVLANALSVAQGIERLL